MVTQHDLDTAQAAIRFEERTGRPATSLAGLTEQQKSLIRQIQGKDVIIEDGVIYESEGKIDLLNLNREIAASPLGVGGATDVKTGQAIKVTPNLTDQQQLTNKTTSSFDIRTEQEKLLSSNKMETQPQPNTYKDFVDRAGGFHVAGGQEYLSFKYGQAKEAEKGLRSKILPFPLIPDVFKRKSDPFTQEVYFTPIGGPLLAARGFEGLFTPQGQTQIEKRTTKLQQQESILDFPSITDYRKSFYGTRFAAALPPATEFIGGLKLSNVDLAKANKPYDTGVTFGGKKQANQVTAIQITGKDTAEANFVLNVRTSPVIAEQTTPLRNFFNQPPNRFRVISPERVDTAKAVYPIKIKTSKQGSYVEQPALIQSQRVGAKFSTISQLEKSGTINLKQTETSQTAIGTATSSRIGRFKPQPYPRADFKYPNKEEFTASFSSIEKVSQKGDITIYKSKSLVSGYNTGKNPPVEGYVLVKSKQVQPPQQNLIDLGGSSTKLKPPKSLLGQIKVAEQSSTPTLKKIQNIRAKHQVTTTQKTGLEGLSSPTFPVSKTTTKTEVENKNIQKESLTFKSNVRPLKNQYTTERLDTNIKYASLSQIVPTQNLRTKQIQKEEQDLRSLAVTKLINRSETTQTRKTEIGTPRFSGLTYPAPNYPAKPPTPPKIKLDIPDLKSSLFGIRKSERKIKEREYRYTPSLQPILFQKEPLSISKKQYKKLSKTKLSGLEVRPKVRIK